MNLIATGRRPTCATDANGIDRDAGTIQSAGGFEICSVSEGISRVSQQSELCWVVDIRSQRTIQANVVQILRPAKRKEEFRQVRWPSTDVFRQGLKHFRRAFAPPPDHSVPDIQPVALSHRLLEQVGAYERPD